MGEFAEYALDEVMDAEEERLDFHLGNMSNEEAYEKGIIDHFGGEMGPELPKQQKIVAAAIKDRLGNIWSLPPPARHHTIIHHMYDHGARSNLDGQGFVDEDGVFYTREEAAKLVLKNGQCKGLKAPPELFSEDLW